MVGFSVSVLYRHYSLKAYVMVSDDPSSSLFETLAYLDWILSSMRPAV